VPCGREGEGPHLPPVSEALNRENIAPACLRCPTLGLTVGLRSNSIPAGPHQNIAVGV
jgi:hypothetical protein